jgi:hypothetical protein
VDGGMLAAGLLVSAAAWFLGDWVGGVLFPHDGVSAFILSWTFAVVAGALAMFVVRSRALRSGKYEKGAWGVRRKPR